jgi:hypothetical protein
LCESLSIVDGSPEENELQGITNWGLRERDVDTKTLRPQKQPVARGGDFLWTTVSVKQL